MTRSLSLLALCLASAPVLSQQPAEPLSLDPARYEELGASVRDVDVIVEDVFDPTNPEEDKRIYHLANRVHKQTRPHVIENMLLVRPGAPFEQRLLEESARILRTNIFVAEATVRVVRYDAASNTVDVEARVRDAWSFTPDIRFGRHGGFNEFGVTLDESNLFGYGKELILSRDVAIERNSTFVRYVDPNLLGSRGRLDATVSDNSDGHRRRLALGRPFYALDSRWSVESEIVDDERVDPIYDLGEIVDEFARDSEFLEISGGWSRGLVDGRATRWLVGATHDRNVFAPSSDVPQPLLLPPDRKLVYPWVGMQIVVDDFRELTQLSTMGRVEDTALGLNLNLRLGYAAPRYGADRDALIFSLGARKGWEPRRGAYVFLDLESQARREDEGVRNALLRTSLRYFQRNFDQRHLFMASFRAVASEDLDADRQVLLGGDSGLRGYPLRYQTGEHSALISVEQRFFTNWYPWRLFQVGGAVFLDAGRVWGRDPRGEPSRGALYDVGFGLRLASPRFGSRQLIHVDLAFPLNRDDSIDAVQLLIESKTAF
jgi:hypothetical protein